MEPAADLVVDKRFVIPAEELTWRFSPSGGPGGQHANRSNTRAELQYDLGNSRAFPPDIRTHMVRKLGRSIVTVVADDTRSQWRNRVLARDRLGELLTLALVRPRRRRPTTATAASRQRRLAVKKVRSRTKQLRARPSGED